MVLHNVALRRCCCRLLTVTDCLKVSERSVYDRKNTRFSYERNDFLVCGQQYFKDEYTNLTTYLMQKITRNLLKSQHNPISLVAAATKHFFSDFKTIDYDNPVVTPQANFDALLIPKNHPSRSTTDTYYLNKDHLLRTHTSAHQTDCLSQGCGKFICIADVYRRDEIDRNHYPCFHQCEAFDTFSPEEVSWNLSLLKKPVTIALALF